METPSKADMLQWVSKTKSAPVSLFEPEADEAYEVFASAFPGIFADITPENYIADYDASCRWWHFSYDGGHHIHTRAARLAMVGRFDTLRLHTAMARTLGAVSDHFAEKAISKRVAEINETPEGQYVWTSMWHPWIGREASSIAKAVRDRIAPRAMSRHMTNTGAGI